MAIWDLHAKLGLFWDQIWTLVPIGTKSQIWDFNRAADYICSRESVYWWMRIHRGLKKVCITHCERVLESVERAAGGLVVDVAQQVQGEQSVRRQLARRSCCEVWLISQPRFSALI